MIDENAAFIRETVRKYEYDWYLLSLFAPASVQPYLWALFAFNHEIAKTRDVVSDTTLGLIRLQWWRDEIGKIYDGKGGGQNPVLSTLAEAIPKFGLARENFETLIYAHEFDLEDIPPANLEGLHHYADFTTTPLVTLALKISGESENQDIIREISGKYGVLRLMRNVPFMLIQRRCMLPLDSLVAINLSPQKLIDFNHKQEISDVIKLILPASDSYRKPNSRFLLRIEAMHSIYLKQLRKFDFDVFSAGMRKNPPFLALRLLLA